MQSLNVKVNPKLIVNFHIVAVTSFLILNSDIQLMESSTPEQPYTLAFTDTDLTGCNF